MTARRISVHDYPEHLNPFYENYNGGAEIANRSKYNTWSLAGKYKIKHTLDKSWAAIHGTPSKSKIGRKLSFLKAVTVDKLHIHSSKKKSTPALTTSVPSSSVNAKGSISAVSTPSPTRYTEPFIIMSPKQKEKLRQQRLAAEAAAAAEEPTAGASSNEEADTIQQNGVDASSSHSGQEHANHVDATVHAADAASSEIVVNGNSSRDESSSDMDNSATSVAINHPDELSPPKSGVNSAMSTPLLERSYDSQGVRPKLRKKRAAPRPPQEEHKTVFVESEKICSPVEPETPDSISSSNNQTEQLDAHHTIDDQKQLEINGNPQYQHNDNIQISTAHVVLSSRKSNGITKTATPPLVNQTEHEEESKEKENNSNNNGNKEKTKDKDNTHNTTPEDELNNNREKENPTSEENNNLVSEEVTTSASNLEKVTKTVGAEKEEQPSETTAKPTSEAELSTTSEIMKTNIDKLQIDSV